MIDRIAVGGMAEVFRAESASVADFRKQVAIKRVLPALVDNQRFIRMFLDEARLSARLSHRNIVQVFDVGRDAESYFIVMEYVDGVTLKQVIEHVQKRGKTVAVPLVVHIGIEMCAALSYAHKLTDEQGRPLGVVHRDVSPANVILERSGGVKLLDFGLAKAATQLEHTDPGIVKGKVAYLAPELVEGQEPDAQADLFATGIVLWEMLAGRSLFGGATDIETVQNARAARVPSLRALNPAVPASLDAVIRKALARDKAARYPDVAALARALTDVQFERRMPVHDEDVSRLVAEVMDVGRGGAAPEPDQGVNTFLGTRSRGGLTQEQLLGLVSLPKVFNILSVVGQGAVDVATDVATAPQRIARAAVRRWGVPIALAIAAVIAMVAVAAYVLFHARAQARAAQTDAPRGPALPAAAATRATTATTGDAATDARALGAADADGGAGQSADAAARLLPAQDAPSWVERSAVFRATQQQIYGCSERFGAQGRHARVFVTYEGATGAAVQVRINSAHYAHGPVARCIESAVRDHPVYPFRNARWQTDYEFIVP